MATMTPPHPLTIKSIEHIASRTDHGAWCCERKGDRWWLCDYHQGFDDGVEAAVTPEHLDEIEECASENSAHRARPVLDWVTSMRSKPHD